MSEAAVFAIIYFMTLFEKTRSSCDVDNRYRTWLYDADCMNLIWKTFRAIGVEPPSYSTQEEMSFQGPDYLRPPAITNYHLMVVISLTSFATSRAMLARMGSPLAAVVLKWVFVGVVTPALYFIGLYERDPVHKLDVLLRGSAIQTIHLVTNEGFF
ncbi:hypothetical protein BJ165DRAFT_438502 [Panaeolus papilionaceus]|nr:hypothetical protein BJ165DRAFT_438502 [Panaeolus papilionaceus]